MISGQGTTVYHSATNSYRNQQEDSELKNVQVVIEFTRIGEIDTMNEKYQAEVIIESKWVEKREMTSYDPDVDWNPKVSCSLGMNSTRIIMYSLRILMLTKVVYRKCHQRDKGDDYVQGES